MIPTGYKPRFGLFHIIAIIGLSLSAYYGHALMTWDDLTDEEIEQSVEINLALDLNRRGPHLQPDDATRARMREQVRAEIVGERAVAKEKIERRLGVGLLLTVAGGIRLLMARGM